MAVIVKLRKAHLQEMLAHALEDAPIECCGLLAWRNGELVSVHPAKNVSASPYRFEIHPLETRRLMESMEEAGNELAGFYHSHTGSEARPSPTDIRMMGPLFGPPYVHFVIGVADREAPHARVFQIADGTATEHEFALLDDD